MAAVAHRCPSCSAPLPAAEPGSAVTCGHCGVQSRLPGRDDASDTATIIGGQPEAGAGKGGGCGALLLVFGVPFGIVGLVVCASIALPGLIGGGAAGLVVVGDAREQAEEAQREAMERVLEAQREAEERRLEEAEARGISRSQLVEIPRGWTNFAERPPGVDLADMDPVDVIPWAREVARSWSPDAELYRVDLDHVPGSGRMDMVHDDQASMDLRFFSPKRRQAADALREVSEETMVTGFRMAIAEGGIRITSGGGPRDADEHRPLPESLCAMPTVMEASATREQAQIRPFYAYSLRIRTPYSGYTDWLWYRDHGGAHVYPDTCEPWSLGLARRRAR